jgi:hypothetical protein
VKEGIVKFDIPEGGGQMKRYEKGFSTLLATAAIAVVFLIIMTGFLVVSLGRQLITKQLTFQGQALNAAEAGLTDAINFFRRQGTQPVVAFNPQKNLLAVPPVDDSDVPTIGIVRTYRVSALGNVWARYEVRKEDLDVPPDGVQADEAGKGTRDISKERGNPVPGTLWQVESHGIVFVDNNNNSTFDWTDTNGNNVWDTGEPGNGDKVLTEQVLRTTLQRITMATPGGAAINAIRGDNVVIGNGSGNARVLGSAGIGIAYPPATNAPTVDVAIPPLVTGSPALNGGCTLCATATIQQVFGVSQQELTGSADFTSFAQLSQPFSMKLVVLNGNTTFDATTPLIGSGILVVIGNLTIRNNSNSNFSGLIYVTGIYTQRAPSLISGAVVGLGNITMEGAGDFSEVDYDTAMIQQIQSEMVQYRFGRNPFIWREN